MTYTVIARPCTNIIGTIEVPDFVENPDEYIAENFGDVEFGEPKMDFRGCDYDVEIAG